MFIHVYMHINIYVYFCVYLYPHTYMNLRISYSPVFYLQKDYVLLSLYEVNHQKPRNSKLILNNII